MEQLLLQLNKVLANTFVMYFKAHSFHWNVEGVHFSQYHDFFGDLYKELHGAIDPMAEEIRALNAYAPTTLTEMYAQKSVSETGITGNEVRSMLALLQADNEEIIRNLSEAFVTADAAGEQGLADFLAGRLDCHKKHGWMIRASLRGM